MQTFIVYVNDQAHALKQLAPMICAHDEARWVLVGCPPRLNRHCGRWVTKAAQKKWRQDWTDTNLAEIAKVILARGNPVSTRLASGPLVNVTKQLRGELGTSRVLDARRPRLGQTLEPVTIDQPSSPQPSPWLIVGGSMALGAAVASAIE